MVKWTMFEQLAIFLWNHLGAIIISSTLTFLTLAHAAILRWRRQSTNDRDLARSAHGDMKKVKGNIEKTLTLVSDMAEAQKMQAEELRELKRSLDVLSKFGPEAIERELSDLGKRFSALDATVQAFTDRIRVIPGPD